MAEVTGVVRTRRVEVVDELGRVRVVLGLVGRDEFSEIWGVLVRDENGRDRVWAIHDGPVAEVGLDFGGTPSRRCAWATTGKRACSWN